MAALYTLVVQKSFADLQELHQVISVADVKITFGVDVSSIWETKLAAIKCHITQLSSIPLLNASEERQQISFNQNITY